MAGRLIPSNRHWWTWMVLGGDPEAEELQGALQGDAWLVMSGALGCYSGLAGQAKLIYIYIYIPPDFGCPSFRHQY